MQEDARISQRLVYDHLPQNQKWEFPIIPKLRKSCNLAYQKQKLGDKEKKEDRVESENENI